MKIHYRDFTLEGEAKELIEFHRFSLSANVVSTNKDQVYVIDTPKEQKNSSSAKVIHHIPTKYLDKTSPTIATDQQKADFLNSIKPSIYIDLNSRQGLRQRIISVLMTQDRVEANQIMKLAKTNKVSNIRKAIKFLRQAGCVVRVEHYYQQHNKDYFDNNLGPTALITLMSLGTPKQGKKARAAETEVWRKYAKPVQKATPAKKPTRVVEAQKLLDTPNQN